MLTRCWLHSLCPAEAALLAWGWRVPFLLASVSLAAGVALRYNMPESVEFTSNHDELDHEYHRRLQQQQQARRHQQHIMHGCQQHQLAASCTEGHSPAAKDAAVPAASSSSAEESERTEQGWADEAGSAGDADAADASRHYVPLLELFRGYWSGLALHVAYAACECVQGC